MEAKISERDIEDLKLAVKHNDTDVINSICQNYNTSDLRQLFTQVFLDFEDTPRYKKSVDYIMSHFLNIDEFDRIAKKIMMNHTDDNIQFMVYFFSTTDLIEVEHMLMAYLQNSSHRSTIKSLHNIHSIIKALLQKESIRPEILYYYIPILINMLATTDLSDINKKQLLTDLLNTLIDNRKTYNNQHMLSTLLSIVNKVDDSECTMLSTILNNYYKYRHTTSNFEEVIRKLFVNRLPYMNKEYINTFTYFLEKHNVEVSVKYIVDDLNDKFVDIQEEAVIKVFKYLNSKLSKHTDTKYNTKYTKESSVDKDYKYIFSHIEPLAIEMGEVQKLYASYLLSFQLDTIKKYKSRIITRERLTYKDLVKIFYLNYYDISSLEEDVEEENYVFTLFYQKLYDITGIDYSYHQIEEDPLLKLFTGSNYGIISMIEQYSDRLGDE